MIQEGLIAARLAPSAPHVVAHDGEAARDL
jgi:hypothetical protein